jgi:cytochrome P450
MADVPRLEHTRKVLKESLRLYPPVFGVLREPVRDDQIGGYQIPAGATIAMNQIAVHYEPKFFNDPKAFTPERWTDSFEESLPQFAYFPFSGGPHRCIGERFAMLEATLVTATIAQSYHLELLSDPNLTLKPSVTTRPDPSEFVRVRVT